MLPTQIMACISLESHYPSPVLWLATLLPYSHQAPYGPAGGRGSSLTAEGKARETSSWLTVLSFAEIDEVVVNKV